MFYVTIFVVLGEIVIVGQPWMHPLDCTNCQKNHHFVLCHNFHSFSLLGAIVSVGPPWMTRLDSTNIQQVEKESNGTFKLFSMDLVAFQCVCNENFHFLHVCFCT